MAHFYGSIDGRANTQATRTGTKGGGLRAHIRGWENGVRVVAAHENGKDVFYVFQTSGSNGRRADRFLFTVYPVKEEN